MASLGDVDAWHALRSRHLDAELSVLRRRRPEERRSCLRALRLELHPDKQPIERRSAASELFTRVQFEWEKHDSHGQGDSNGYATPEPRQRSRSPPTPIRVSRLSDEQTSTYGDRCKLCQQQGH